MKNKESSILVLFRLSVLFVMEAFSRMISASVERGLMSGFFVGLRDHASLHCCTPKKSDLEVRIKFVGFHPKEIHLK